MDSQSSKTTAAVSLERCKATDQTCPTCGSANIVIFYRVDDIPVHSCLLMDSRTEAVNYPRHSLHLGFCRKCGFIYNTVFDGERHEYSTRYEETQAFSPRFNSFASSLAERLVRRYDIRDRDVLEIGCGKGDFLVLLCRLGPNRGIGVDPAYVPERMKDPGRDVKFIQDFYNEQYADLPADVICCRHTLEHIGPTGEFLQTLRRTIGDRHETLVFFEVPDVMRELREGAFWDLYYEHCSYFSSGSLARLFRRCRFDLVDLFTDYGDQYLMMTANPAEQTTSPRLGQEDDLEALHEAVESFAETCTTRMAYWRDRICADLARDRRTVLWGSGSKGVSFLTTMGMVDEIEFVVDVNPYRHGKYMPGTGQRIVAPEFLVDYEPETIIVMNPVYCEEIQRDLDRLGVEAKLTAA